MVWGKNGKSKRRQGVIFLEDVGSAGKGGVCGKRARKGEKTQPLVKIRKWGFEAKEREGPGAEKIGNTNGGLSPEIINADECILLGR